jgi:hypothetical protein
MQPVEAPARPRAAERGACDIDDRCTATAHVSDAG